MILIAALVFTLLSVLLVYKRPMSILGVYALFLTFAFFPFFKYDFGPFQILHSRLYPVILCLMLIFKFTRWNKAYWYDLWVSNKFFVYYLLIFFAVNTTMALHHYFQWSQLPSHFLRNNLLSLWPIVLIVIPRAQWNLKEVIRWTIAYLSITFILVSPSAIRYFLDSGGQSLWRFNSSTPPPFGEDYLFSTNIAGTENYFFYLSTLTVLIFAVLQGLLIGLGLKWFYRGRNIFLALLGFCIPFFLLALTYATQNLKIYIMFYMQIGLFFLVAFLMRKKEKFSFYYFKSLLLIFLTCFTFYHTEGAQYLNYHFFNKGAKRSEIKSIKPFANKTAKFKAISNNFYRGMLATRFLDNEDLEETFENDDGRGTRFQRNKFALKRMWEEYRFSGTGYPPCRGCDKDLEFPGPVTGLAAPGGSEIISHLIYFGYPFGIIFDLFFIFPLLIFFKNKLYKKLTLQENYFFLCFFLSNIGFRLVSIWGISLGMLALIHMVTIIFSIIYLKLKNKQEDPSLVSMSHKSIAPSF